MIIGGGPAGARLAARLAPAARVTVLAEEPHPAYNRVLLADVLAGRYPADVIALPGPADGVTWHAGVRAARIDRDRRLVLRDDDGAPEPYDTLVLATGANPVLPPLTGLRLPGGGLPEGVRAFRTLDDCRALGGVLDARPDASAVVIGGGLLGVLAAAALARRGARVFLAQRGEHLLDRHLDPAAAGLLAAHLAGAGVEVHTECAVRGLLTGDGGAVRGVRLADGYELPADLVVLACGVRPRAGLARDAGLATGATGGVTVDDRLTTSDPAIHAIGDCAEHAGVSYGLAGAAQDQADVLADILRGAPHARYAGTRALVRLTLPDGPAPFDLAAFGRPVAGPPDDVVRLDDATRGAYRALVVRDDRLRGGVLVGDLGGVGSLARAWEADEALPATAPLLHLLTHDGGC